MITYVNYYMITALEYHFEYNYIIDFQWQAPKTISETQLHTQATSITRGGCQDGINIAAYFPSGEIKMLNYVSHVSFHNSK